MSSPCLPAVVPNAPKRQTKFRSVRFAATSTTNTSSDIVSNENALPQYTFAADAWSMTTTQWYNKWNIQELEKQMIRRAGVPEPADTEPAAKVVRNAAPPTFSFPNAATTTISKSPTGITLAEPTRLVANKRSICGAQKRPLLTIRPQPYLVPTASGKTKTSPWIAESMEVDCEQDQEMVDVSEAPFAVYEDMDVDDECLNRMEVDEFDYDHQMDM